MIQVLVIINDIFRNPLVSKSLEINGKGISISFVCSPTTWLGLIQIFKTVNVIQWILTSHNVPLSSYPSWGLVNQPTGRIFSSKKFLYLEPQEKHSPISTINSPWKNWLRTWKENCKQQLVISTSSWAELNQFSQMDLVLGYTSRSFEVFNQPIIFRLSNFLCNSYLVT